MHIISLPAAAVVRRRRLPVSRRQPEREWRRRTCGSAADTDAILCIGHARNKQRKITRENTGRKFVT